MGILNFFNKYPKLFNIGDAVTVVNKGLKNYNQIGAVVQNDENDVLVEFEDGDRAWYYFSNLKYLNIKTTKLSSCMSTENPDINYPCLMEDKGENGDESRVVLFTKYGSGTLIYCSDNCESGIKHCIGISSDNWYMPFFNPFNGKVVVEN